MVFNSIKELRDLEHKKQLALNLKWEFGWDNNKILSNKNDKSLKEFLK